MEILHAAWVWLGKSLSLVLAVLAISIAHLVPGLAQPIFTPPAASTTTAASSTPTGAFPLALKAPNHTPAPATQASTTTPKDPTKVTIEAPAPTFFDPKTASQINTDTRAALVNILCTTGVGGSFEPLSGSGVFITGSGVILTNAHVAQYFLLHDYPTPGNVDCVIRTGSPAMPLYRAALLYLPPSWIDQNAAKVGIDMATSTGEDDYAFLVVTSSIHGDPLPSPFPSLAITANTPNEHDQAFIAAYAAQYLGGVAIQKSLYASSAYTKVMQLYGFHKEAPAVDEFSLSSSVVSQTGSSGGAVVRPQDGALEGIITSEDLGASTADRLLYALTLGSIDRSLEAHGAHGLVPLVSGDVMQKATDFTQNTAPALTQKLIDALEHH